MVSIPSSHQSSRGGVGSFAVCLRCSLLIYFLLFVWANSTHAQLLNYGTFSGYGLGKGILGNDYTTPLAACITGTEKPLPASHANVRASIVYSSDEYKQAFHIDQNAEATFLGIGGGGEELHFGQETGSSGSAFDIIIEAYGEHDSDTLNHINWDPKYQIMMDTGDPAKIQKVREDCGDRYIQTVFNEARLFVVLHVSSSKQSSLTTFSGKVHGTVGVDVLSASQSLGGDLNVSSAHKDGALGLSVYTEGLGGVIPAAAALGIADADGLQAIATKLNTYLASLKETGQPVKYQLAPLPGMRTQSLTDAQIFASLRDLKSNYIATSYRLGNVQSLISGDQRQILFKQPEANAALKKQLSFLTNYLNAVAEAHETCRKALVLATCSAQISKIGAPPPRPAVELAPVLPPLVGVFTFAIDGTPVAPGENSRLIAGPAKTLLDAARLLRPNAKNVDVVAPIINGEYLAFVDVPVLAPAPPYSPRGVGSLRLLGQDLSWPTYWKVPTTDSLSLHVLHADTDHPCSILNSGGLNFIDGNCLTATGHSLRDTALANVAQYVINQSPTTYDVQLYGVGNSCFGQTSTIPLAGIHLVVAPSTIPNEVSARVGVFLQMVNISVPLIEQEEAHNLPTWNVLAQTRLDGLATMGAPSNNPDTCAPHIQ